MDEQAAMSERQIRQAMHRSARWGATVGALTGAVMIMGTVVWTQRGDLRPNVDTIAATTPPALSCPPPPPPP